MRKLITALFVFGLIGMTDAQVKTPQASLSAEVEQMVGLTKMEVNYSRPNKNNREIFGGLVPFGEIWRTGANKNTTIEFNDDVTIGGQRLNKGTYAIYTIPEQDNWTILFYKDSDNWGNPQKWDDSKVALKTSAKTSKLEYLVESFTISFDDVSANSVMLNFSWDRTKAGVKIEVPTKEKVMASIKTTMNGKPTYQDYIAAATYYYNTREDFKQAKEWMDRGMKENPNPAYYQIYQQAMIYMESGDIKGATKLANDALQGAQKANDKNYIKMASELYEKLSKTK